MVFNVFLQKYVENVKQDASIGTNILRVSASDEDADNNGAIIYTLSAPVMQSDIDYFEIQPESGWIVLKKPLDVSFLSPFPWYDLMLLQYYISYTWSVIPCKWVFLDTSNGNHLFKLMSFICITNWDVQIIMSHPFRNKHNTFYWKTIFPLSLSIMLLSWAVYSLWKSL